MYLSEIKFEYQEKIDNINHRIDTYEQIIKKYEVKIKKAQKEEKPRISSVNKAKEDYTRKIKRMVIIRKYYQEFVDTADYLLQHLNNNKNSLLFMKIEQLKKQNKQLVDEIDTTKKLLDDHKDQVEKLMRTNDKNTDSILKKDIKIKKQQKKIDEQNNIIVTQKVKGISLRDRNKLNSKIDCLKDEKKNLERKIQSLQEDNNDLQRKNIMLEEYCNTLLSCESINDSPSVISYDENIFEQISKNSNERSDYKNGGGIMDYLPCEIEYQKKHEKKNEKDGIENDTE